MNVDNIFKSFTVIDLMGMLIPGSIIVLLTNYYFFDLTVFFIKFFGDAQNNNFILFIYFITTSYVIGTLSHEISKGIEIIIHKIFFTNVSLPCSCFNKYSNGMQCKIKKNINKIWGIKNIHMEEKKYANEIFSLIYTYVQKNGNMTKIALFNGFSDFCRTICVSILYCGIILIYIRKLPICVAIVTFICLILLCAKRSYRFKSKEIDYIYREFATLSL